MESGNQSSGREFILLGFSHLPQLKVLLFVIFLILYAVTLIGNLAIIMISWLDPCLHTPMYFFLTNLSFLDICSTTTSMPNLLVNLLAEKRSISFIGCMVQLHFFISVGGTECVLLMVMAYDRYIAICQPLHYIMAMSKRLCTWLAVISWLAGFLNSLIQTIIISQLAFCHSNVINHYLCDIPPVLEIACGDAHITDVSVPIASFLLVMIPFLIILVSYIHIGMAVLRIPSAKGRHKAFSTCTSHLTVVLLYFGTAIFMYTRPKANYSMERDRVVSLLYCAVVPMLNPVIYTLRNQEVRQALGKVGSRMVSLMM
ncbi:olfactory receptor 5V1-like [Rhinatrema bivittatum]|uniref:olfactory receptor 5V1-like n=1 Tax=Rhinatrema bivittatum TaxID=194408 RepID=UPI001126A6F4|nr:olfactory receptor 5V1-like [Rhinatrema bivittatum]